MSTQHDNQNDPLLEVPEDSVHPQDCGDLRATRRLSFGVALGVTTLVITAFGVGMLISSSRINNPAPVSLVPMTIPNVPPAGMGERRLPPPGDMGEPPDRREPPNCSTGGWWNASEHLVVDFLDAAEIGAQAVRTELSGILVEMREAQREFERVPYGDCNEALRSTILHGMESAIHGFGSPSGNAEGATLSQLAAATDDFAQAYAALQAENLFADLRMADTSTFIWGGSSSNTSTVQTVDEGQEIPGCDYALWTEEVASLLRIIEQVHKDSDVSAASFQMSVARSLVSGLDYPSCIGEGRQHLIDGLHDAEAAYQSAAAGDLEAMQQHQQNMGTNLALCIEAINHVVSVASPPAAPST